MMTKVERVVQCFLDGETLTTKKAERLVKCRSASTVINDAEKELKRMGYNLTKLRRKVRGSASVMFYKMEVK
jgi:hypothetical protein